MTDLHLDRDKCRERNVLTGLRGTVESTPIRFVKADTGTVVAARGALPSSPDAALELINAKIPGPKLTADQVLLHQMEAASTRFVADRSMFLHPSTLKNIVRDASNGGFAFMNSHRTGDLSTPSELPFGRAYAGSYQTVLEANGSKVKRAMLGVYMLKGQAPNGANGPTTDALSAAIDGGTIFDVSMGLYGGWKMCDLCQCDLMARDEEGNYLCHHVPGTHRKMTKEQKDAQKARGIADGVASYSLVDASPGEVSAVYDGAVPGAGFGKLMRLAKRRAVSPAELRQAFSRPSHLLPRIGPKEGHAMPRMSIREWLGLLPSVDSATLTEDEDEVMPERTFTPPATFTTLKTDLLPSPTPPPTPDPDVERLRKELDQLKAERKAESDQRISVDADRFAKDLLAENRIVPAQTSHYATAYVQAARDDRDHPIADGLTRTQQLRKCGESNRDHGLTREYTAADAGKFRVLSNDGDATEPDAQIKADRADAERYAKKLNGKSS